MRAATAKYRPEQTEPRWQAQAPACLSRNNPRPVGGAVFSLPPARTNCSAVFNINYTIFCASGKSPAGKIYICRQAAPARPTP